MLMAVPFEGLGWLVGGVGKLGEAWCWWRCNTCLVCSFFSQHLPKERAAASAQSCSSLLFWLRGPVHVHLYWQSDSAPGEPLWSRVSVWALCC